MSTETIDDGALWGAMRTLLRDAQTATAIADGVAYLDSAAHLAVAKAKELLCEEYISNALHAHGMGQESGLQDALNLIDQLGAERGIQEIRLLLSHCKNSENTVGCEDGRGTSQYPEKTSPSNRGTAAPVSQQSAAAQNAESTHYPTPELDGELGNWALDEDGSGDKGVTIADVLRGAAQADIAAAVEATRKEERVNDNNRIAYAECRRGWQERIAEMERKEIALNVELAMSRDELSRVRGTMDAAYAVEANRLQKRIAELEAAAKAEPSTPVTPDFSLSASEREEQAKTLFNIRWPRDEWKNLGVEERGRWLSLRDAAARMFTPVCNSAFVPSAETVKAANHLRRLPNDAVQLWKEQAARELLDYIARDIAAQAAGKACHCDEADLAAANVRRETCPEHGARKEDTCHAADVNAAENRPDPSSVDGGVANGSVNPAAPPSSITIKCCTCSQEHIDNPNIWANAAKIQVSPENAARLLHVYRWRLTEAGWECGIHRGIPEGTTFVPMTARTT